MRTSLPLRRGWKPPHPQGCAPEATPPIRQAPQVGLALHLLLSLSLISLLPLPTSLSPSLSSAESSSGAVFAPLLHTATGFRNGKDPAEMRLTLFSASPRSPSCQACPLGRQPGDHRSQTRFPVTERVCFCPRHSLSSAHIGKQGVPSPRVCSLPTRPLHTPRAWLGPGPGGSARDQDVVPKVL